MVRAVTGEQFSFEVLLSDPNTIAELQATARLYDQLGLPEYEAMEAFVQYDPVAQQMCLDV